MDLPLDLGAYGRKAVLIKEARRLVGEAAAPDAAPRFRRVACDISVEGHASTTLGWAPTRAPSVFRSTALAPPPPNDHPRLCSTRVAIDDPSDDAATSWPDSRRGIGAGVVAPASAIVSLRASGALLVACDRFRPDSATTLRTFRQAPPDHRRQMGAILAPTDAPNWLGRLAGEYPAALTSAVGPLPAPGRMPFPPCPGGDPFAGRSIQRPWLGSDMAAAGAMADAAFGTFRTRGVSLFRLDDADVSSAIATFAVGRRQPEEMAEHFAADREDARDRLLRSAAMPFTHRRVIVCATTNRDPDLFAHAAATVKARKGSTRRRGGEDYAPWGGREGRETPPDTNLARASQHAGRFLSLALDRRRRIGIGGRRSSPSRRRHQGATRSLRPAA